MVSLHNRLITLGQQEPPPEMTMEEAQGVAQRTHELLGTRGWCFWRCSLLGGDVITILPDGYELSEEEEKQLMRQLAIVSERVNCRVNKEWLGVIYTESELAKIADMDIGSIRLVHKAKKSAGAQLI